MQTCQCQAANTGWWWMIFLVATCSIFRLRAPLPLLRSCLHCTDIQEVQRSLALRQARPLSIMRARTATCWCAQHQRPSTPRSMQQPPKPWASSVTNPNGQISQSRGAPWPSTPGTISPPAGAMGRRAKSASRTPIAILAHRNVGSADHVSGQVAMTMSDSSRHWSPSSIKASALTIPASSCSATQMAA